MEVFSAHPSIRLLESDTNFEPLPCLDAECVHSSVQHMHCPFCIKSEVFTDSAILRAHYCVKHIDKGIEFAGLKIARCCDCCDIVGFMKSVKVFRGAHWHCFRCKNGFSRRDEALKHYQTHFKCPQTTFQIHIAQEVYPPDVIKAARNAAIETSPPTAACFAIITPPSSSLIEDLNKPLEAEAQECVGANETVSTSCLNNQTSYVITTDNIDLSCVNDGSSLNLDITAKDSDAEWLQQKAMLEAQIAELMQKNERLTREKDALEQTVLLMKTSPTCHNCGKPAMSLDRKMKTLIDQMKAQYDELLKTHLIQLQTHVTNCGPSFRLLNKSSSLPTNHVSSSESERNEYSLVEAFRNGGLHLQLMVSDVPAETETGHKMEAGELVDSFSVDEELPLSAMTKDDYFCTDNRRKRKQRNDISLHRHCRAANEYESSPEVDCSVEESECS